MHINLHPPTARQKWDFLLDATAVQVSQDVTNSLANIVRNLAPFTVAAIAQNLRPDLPTHEALAELSIQADAILAEVGKFNVDAYTAESAENARIAPLFDRATRRMMELFVLIPSLDSQIASFKANRAAKLKKLVGAGLSPDEAELMAGDKAPASLIEQRATAQTECDALQAFIRTKDESLLPEGFLVTE